ncbi:MAG: ShlB/FhaC/HecB family hemolysin secretion/activation protein [Gammaproteobacteria bacterium]
MDHMRLALFFLLAACFAPGRAAEIPAPSFVVEQFVVSGDNPLAPAATDAALAPFLGEHVGIEGLYAARDALRSALRQAGHGFLDVVVPPQTLDGGVVRLDVVGVELDVADVRGNRHFSTDSVHRSLPALVPGAAPQVRALSRDLAVANQHPAKKLKLNFRPSETRADAVDALVDVTDKRPWALFAGLNNIGNKSTGYTRLAVGGQYSDVTGHDDVFTGSFTTSPDNADDVQQYGAFYQLPLYALHGWLTAFYVKSDVDVGNVQDAFDISGAGDFVGLSFRYELVGVGRYHHSFTAGVQDRLFDTATNSAFDGTPFLPTTYKVRSRPLSLRYDGGYNWAATSFDFYVDLTQNLSFGGHNRQVDYDKARLRSDPGWKVLRIGALVTQRLPRGFLGVGKMTGQYATEPLLPGEQIGFGGDRSVRGFEQRTIAGDKGVQFNLEVWTPPVERLYGVRFLGFFDAAHKVTELPTVGQRPNDTISSIGIGARWQWREELVASLDYGQPLANADGEAADRGNSKIHFNLEYRY